MIKVAIPYWENKPQVMYSTNPMWYRAYEYPCAKTIAWFLFGNKWRIGQW